MDISENLENLEIYSKFNEFQKHIDANINELKQQINDIEAWYKLSISNIHNLKNTECSCHHHVILDAMLTNTNNYFEKQNLKLLNNIQKLNEQQKNIMFIWEYIINIEQEAIEKQEHYLKILRENELAHLNIDTV